MKYNRFEKKCSLIFVVVCHDYWLWLFTLIVSIVIATQEQLGPQQEDKVTDVQFADVGKVYIDTFRIEGLNATLDVKIEDTQGIDEYWLLDFQPYLYNEDSPPINKVTAYMSAARTGQCSSVEQDQTWADDYFHDDFFQNHSASGDKLLFTDFTRGTDVVAGGIRTDDIRFEGEIDTFLTCQQTDGSSIWVSNIHDEEIEYATVLYATNLRPQASWQEDTSFQIPAVGFLQTNIYLIWRLARIAIVNSIMTSKGIEHIGIFALFDFAIVEPVLLEDGLTPLLTHTRLCMGFSTYVPIEDNGMLVWIDNTVTYTPLNPDNALTEVVIDPPSVLADTPLCNTVRDPDYCVQSWYYEFVLLLDITELSVEMPLEATGIFGFDFDLYLCSDVATGAACAPKVDMEEPFNVLIDLTLQSTVSALDEAGDGIEVEVIGVTNDAGEDVRNGIVNNQENITMEVVFYPAFLREDYILELQLFMFCKGEELATSTLGCLAAPEEERYTSFLSNDFSYTYDAEEDPNFELYPPTTTPPGFQPGWGEWGFWSDCTATCGSGTRQRTRWCQSNNPQEDCVGDDQEVERCTMPMCNLYTDESGRVRHYESTDRDMDWFASNEYCESKSGTLANINSIGLQQHLIRQYASEIYPKAIQLLFMKEVIQSSTGPGAATLAVNGDTTAVFSDGSCSHTDIALSAEESQWFQIVLEEDFCINKVTIVNRIDCCHERLIDVIVRVGNDSDIDENLQCGSPISEQQAGPGVWVDVICQQPICGRYVSIHSGLGINPGILTLCEVMVYAQPKQGLPQYWIGSQSLQNCLSGDDCPILSECNGSERQPCGESYRAICEYESILVFHAVSGNHENVLALWESSEVHESYSRVAAGQHYKNQLVEDWDQQVVAVDEVKVVLQKYGQVVFELRFDGTGSNKNDWFSEDRLIYWPYEGEPSYNAFSIRAFHDEGNPYRHFYINQQFGACRSDFGWLVVFEEQDPDFQGCAYELAVPPEKPAFMYSDGSSSVNWRQAAVADSFLVYIKYREQIVRPPDGFELVFRGVAGNQHRILSLWQSSSYTDSGERITSGQHYKSFLMNQWDSSDITVQEVLVQLRRAGDKVLEMIFDGSGTDTYNWFTSSRVLDSPFTGIGEGHNYFSVLGHAQIRRHFFINQYYSGCPDDYGWFVVLDHSGQHPCLWDNSYGENFPKFLYSKDGAATNWESGNVGVADEFLVYIKYIDTSMTQPPATYPPPVEYSPDNISPPIAERELNSAEYDTERNVHQSQFTSRPLSDQRETTTMTAVYMLVPLNKKRKREIRPRRSLVKSIELPQLQSTAYGTSGCPPMSTFDPLAFSCDCWPGYTYNLKQFKCLRYTDLAKFSDDSSADVEAAKEHEPSRACHVVCPCSFLILVLVVTINYHI